MADTELTAESRRLVAIATLLAKKDCLCKQLSLSSPEEKRLQDIEAELNALGVPARSNPQESD